MPYPYHILNNEVIHAPAQDVETWIRHILGKHLLQVDRQNLDNTGKRFFLHFKERLFHVEGLDYLIWGGAELIEWSNGTTQIVRMWESTNDSWRSIINDYDHEKLAEEHFQLLEELSDLIKEQFEILPLGQEAEPENQEKDYSALTLKQLDSIVHNTLLIFKGFEIGRLVEGSNIFYTVFANVESSKILLGKYRVWEWHDGSGRSAWVPSDNNNVEIERLRHSVWQAITATAVEAAKSKSTPTEQPAYTRKLKGGRPRNVDDDWAYQQVRILGRDKQEVYAEWLERIGNRRTLLLDSKDSFNKAVSPRRGKRK